MNNFQKANELLKAKGYDLKNGTEKVFSPQWGKEQDSGLAHVGNLTDLVDGYFVASPDHEIFEDLDDWGNPWRTYLVCIIEDVYNQINGYEIDQPTTDRELADLTKFIRYGI
jgi:hypothetical protein